MTMLEKTALAVRQDVIRMLAKAGSGHLAGSLDMTDILVALYFGVARHDPQDPAWTDRDRIILSNGHVCPALYATLAHAGYFPKEDLLTLRTLGSSLQGHPHRLSLPGVETSSGPLGCGVAQGVGMALAARMDAKDWRVFCIASDGEHDEGNTWEAIMLAAKYALGNLCVIVDVNGIQIDGRTADVMPLEPLQNKYEAFGWQAEAINGNDMDAVTKALYGASHGRPRCIIARTIPGKGVAEIENDYRWHGMAPRSQEEAEKFLRQLNEQSVAV